MRSNNIRFDLSDRLIHFFRRVDLEGSSAPLVQPEHFAFNSAVEGTVWPPLFLLRCAVRSHRLWATWSIRNGIRTIFGPHPAVCFSEMPLAAYLETSGKREAAGQAMSGYALTFPKSAMHALGANPVIYGLTNRHTALPSGADARPRLFPECVLPEQEQYRYVTYNPTGPHTVDWLHEREWRWPFQGSLVKVERELEEHGMVSSASDIPGFDFSHKDLRGIGIIVKTEEDAAKLEYDVLALVDRGVVHRKHFDHILIRDRLPASHELYGPVDVQSAIDASLIDFSCFFDFARNKIEEAVRDFSNRVSTLEHSAPRNYDGPLERGGCWLWFHENKNPYVRALVLAGRVIVNKEGRYIASLNELDCNRALRQRQELTLQLAAELKAEFGIESGYFLVLNSFNPDDVPFYIDRSPKNDLYNNFD